jgi:uncharacterized membrane protein YfcA
MEELAFNPYIAFGWCVFAGFIMAMGNGGGGILAGIGHISLLGINDPNMIKAVNLILEFVSRIFSVPIYQKQKRLVWPLALSFAVGAPLGAILGSWFSKTYLSDMTNYKPVFGVLITLVGARVLYEVFSKNKSEQAKKAMAASERVRIAQTNKSATQNLETLEGYAPKTLSVAWNKIRILFAGDEFEFNPLFVAASAFGIAFLGAMVGVGGGFLVTPFMATVLLFPMYLAMGTALVAMMIPLIAGVMTYIVLHVQMDWWLVGIEASGIMFGSFLGPILNQYINERFLKLFVSLVLFAIGLYYLI